MPTPQLRHEGVPVCDKNHVTKILSLTLALTGYGIITKRASAATLSCPVSGIVTINTDDAVDGDCLFEFGSTVTISPYASLTSNSEIDNAGTVDVNNYGSIYNNGSFYNGTSGNSGILNNAGTFESNNYFYNNYQSTVNNSGTMLLNDEYSNNENQSTINNSGSLYNRAFYGLYNESGSTINNSGTFTNESYLDNDRSSLINDGTLHNRDLLRNNNGYIENTGTFNNVGRLESYGQLIDEPQGVPTIQNNVTTLSQGVIVNQAGGTFFNGLAQIDENDQGEPEVDDAFPGSIDLFGNARFNNYGTLVNNYYSTINIYASATLNNQVGGTLTNYGYIYNGSLETLNNRGTLNNSGQIFNEPNGVLNNYGSLTNDGLLYTSGDGFTGSQNDYGMVNHVGATLTNNSALVNRGNAFNNRGTLTNNFGLYNSYDGVIINHEGATWTNQGGYPSGGIPLGPASTPALTNTNNSEQYLSVLNTGIIFNSGQFVLAEQSMLVNSFDPSSTGQYGFFIQDGGNATINGHMIQEAIAIVGGTLTGTGTIVTTGGNAVLIDTEATVNPGNSPGTLMIDGDLDLFGTLGIEVVDSASFDILNVTGDVNLDDSTMIDIALDAAFNPLDGMSFDFLFSEQDIFGFDLLDDDNFTLTGLADGFGWSISFETGNSSWLALNIFSTATPPTGVPSPGTLLLLGAGAPIVAWRARRKLKQVEKA